MPLAILWRDPVVSQSPEDFRPVYFGMGRALQTPIYRRHTLVPGARIKGPAVIEEKTSTTVIYPKQIAQIDGHLNIEISVEEGRFH